MKMKTITYKIEVKPQLVLDIITTAHDAGACNYFLTKHPTFLCANWYEQLKADPTLWDVFAWVLYIDDGTPKGKPQQITYSRIVKGLQKMLNDELAGKYKNPWTRVTDVITGQNFCSSNFAQEVIQYAIFGKVIFA